MIGELGLVVEDVADSMEKFKQSVELFRRLYTLMSEVESQGSRGWW